MLTLRAVGAVLVTGLLLASPGLGAEAIPRDFQLTAEYYPPVPHLGLETPTPREWSRWTLTVSARGRALQETQRSARGSGKGVSTRSVHLTQREIAQLVAAVRAANFHVLAREYAFAVSPAPALVLRVVLDDRYHEVAVYGPDKVKDDPEVAAFLKVWNQAVRLVPPPNPGQGPE